MGYLGRLRAVERDKLPVAGEDGEWLRYWARVEGHVAVVESADARSQGGFTRPRPHRRTGPPPRSTSPFTSVF